MNLTEPRQKNMNIIEAKEHLQKKGYTWFELEELDKESYENLNPLKCNEKENFKHKFTSLRADAVVENRDVAEQIRCNGDFGTFENATEKRKELMELKEKQIVMDYSQIWYFCDNNKILGVNKILNKFDYNKLLKKIMMYFYDYPESQEYSTITNFTYYDIGCKLDNHSDGTGTGRICALLIYLNETYNRQDGGCLVLEKKDTIVPTFGRVAIIDLKSFDIQHMVTEVTGGIGRYALLSFVKRKEDEFGGGEYNPDIK